MRRLFRRGALLLAALLSVALFAPTGQAMADVGPPLTVPTATLAAALSCSSDLASPGKTPVLLTPGTVETSQQAYSWGYQKVLRDQGYPVCVITALPGYGSGDMQTTVDYVVYAIRYMHQTSGQRISVIGHSQGGLLDAWALRFWPDLPGMVDAMISLGSPYTGTGLGNTLCVTGVCQPLSWQLRPGSMWTGAVTRYPIAPGPGFTSIGSTSDELVFPAPQTTRFPGADNVEIQDVCPGRIVGHLGELSDATAYALVLDALSHHGIASPSRVGTGSCAQFLADDIDASGMANLLITAQDVIVMLLTRPTTTAEPPLQSYAVVG